MIRLSGAALVLLCVFCAAALPGGQASAQQASPEVRWLGINSFHSDIELQYQYQKQDIQEKQPATETLTLQQSFHEILKLSMDGFIYHSRLMTFNAAVGLDLQQGTEEVTTPALSQSDSLNSIAPLYSISGVILPQKPVSLSFAFNKFSSTISPPFTGLMTTDVESQLLMLSLKPGPLPSQLSWSHDTTSQTQLGIGENRNEENTTIGFQTSHTLEQSLSSLSYSYLQNHEEVEDVSFITTQTVTDRRVHDAAFNNALQFGDKEQNSLTLRVSLRDESGSFPNSLFNWDEALRLKHTPSLTSNYGLDYTRTAIGSQETDLLSLQAGLGHQLFQSLFSHARVYGSHETFGSSKEDIYGFALSEDYRKRIPWGTLTVALGGGYEITNDQTQPGQVAILRESHTLSDTTTTFLNNPNVIASSIVVTNSAGLVIYLLNVDYDLVLHGLITEIRRTPTGAIANDATVLVNYEFQSSLPIEYGTRDLHGRIQLDLFEHLSLYVSRLSQERSLISGTDQGQLQSLEDSVLGASLRWNPATLTAEHEVYDSTLTPYTSDKVILDVAWRINQIHNLDANAAYRRILFQSAGGGGTTLETVAVTYRAMPPRWPTLSATVGYQWENDSGLRSNYAFGRLRLEYRIRATTMSLDVQLNQRDDTITKTLTQYVFFSIRRHLF